MPELPSADWWIPFYDALLAETLLVRSDPREVEDTALFLIEKLQLRPGARVFDQCCGIGSLANPLAAKGYVLHGVDQAEEYIRRARAAAESDEVQFVAADARDHVLSPPADGAFNWWTSYGYCPTREENRRMLAAAHDSLRPGGRFALDTMNVPGVLRAFEAETITRRSIPQGEVELVRHSRVDLDTGRIHKRWTYRLDGEVHTEHDSSVQLSMPHELAADLQSVGFEVLANYGGIDGRELTIDDHRCILIARRPR